jgi:hypothetical protein
LDSNGNYTYNIEIIDEPYCSYTIILDDNRASWGSIKDKEMYDKFLLGFVNNDKIRLFNNYIIEINSFIDGKHIKKHFSIKELLRKYKLERILNV